MMTASEDNSPGKKDARVGNLMCVGEIENSMDCSQLKKFPVGNIPRFLQVLEGGQNNARVPYLVITDGNHL